MSLFRRTFDRRLALARPAAAHDASAISSLASFASRRYLTGQPDDVLDRLAHDPTAVLEYDNRIVAMAQAGWRMPPIGWLRALLVDSRIDAAAAIPVLIPQLHQLLPGRGIGQLFVTLDDWSAPWCRRPLENVGYRWIMNVLGYEKTRMDMPSMGNQAVVIRRATSDDLGAVLRLDAACFPTPWGKGEEILGPAIVSAPYFSVAEFGGEIIGYVYMTLHQAGRQAHLVRIATTPEFQGRAIGVRLLAESVRFCHHRAIDLLTLNTQESNRQAQRLYEWFGFVRTDDIQTILGFDQIGQPR